jgi:CheY-like chemotaxis protein
VTGPFGKSFSFGSLLQHNAGTNPSPPRDVLLRGVFAVENILILVIEDDPEIQAIIDEALCEGGYEPALAVSGEEAVTLLKGGQIPYRVLVTDINLLGRIDGWEVAKQAREIDPNFPVIYMTGAAADQWPSHGVPNSVLLTKPFAPAQLVTAVSSLLNAGSPPIAPTG